MDFANPFTPINPALMIAIFIWSTFWKILALWRSVKNNQRNWFIAILLISTLGILEIVYLFGFSKTKLTLGDLKKGNFLP